MGNRRKYFFRMDIHAACDNGPGRADSVCNRFYCSVVGAKSLPAAKAKNKPDVTVNWETAYQIVHPVFSRIFIIKRDDDTRVPLR